MNSIVYIILCVLAAYLVYIWWSGGSGLYEPFMAGDDPSGVYYAPIRDTTFIGNSRYVFADDPSEVMFYGAVGDMVNMSALSSLPANMPIATLEQLRREAGYGMHVCEAGFLRADGGSNSFISAYPNTSQLGVRNCGGATYDLAKSRGDCSGGCIMVLTKNPSSGVYVYRNKADAPNTLSVGGATLTLQPHNTITGRWSRYSQDERLGRLETYVVYSDDASGAFNGDSGEKLMVNICKAYDSSGTIANMQQLEADQATGANWKRPGWLGRDNPLKEAYPISDDARAQSMCILGSGAQEPCRAGIYQTKSVDISGTTQTSRGVVCYGKKPAYKDAEKTVTGRTYRAEFFNTYTGRWSKYDAVNYECAVSDLLTSNIDAERNYLKRAGKYVKAMQAAGATITLGADGNATYPGCNQGGGACWACVPTVASKIPKQAAPVEPKSESGNWKSIGETIDPVASLTDVAMDVTTAGGRAKLKKGVENVLACQAAGGVPTMGMNGAYPGCGGGWCCAPDNRFTLSTATIGGAEAAGECEPVEPACIPSELVPTRPIGGALKRQCRPKLAQSIKDTKVNQGAARAAHATQTSEATTAAIMRDVAQQLKADKLYSLCQRADIT
jgi:hypothetical protein